jgi:hypothetical protein
MRGVVRSQRALVPDTPPIRRAIMPQWEGFFPDAQACRESAVEVWSWRQEVDDQMMIA